MRSTECHHPKGRTSGRLDSIGISTPAKLRYKGTGDVDGTDLPLVPRFPGSRRVLTLTELTEIGTSHSVAYQGTGATTQRLGHFRRELGQNGFQLDLEDTLHGTVFLGFSSDDAPGDRIQLSRLGPTDLKRLT